LQAVLSGFVYGGCAARAGATALPMHTGTEMLESRNVDI
jgi:hypothetical protein